MRREEVRQTIDALRRVYPGVRLLDPERKQLITFNELGEPVVSDEVCFATMCKKDYCSDCVAAKACSQHERAETIEFMDMNLFHIDCSEIDMEGRAYALEIVTPIKDNTLLGALGKGPVLKMLDSMHRKLYVDPLTGAMNRRYFEDYVLAIRSSDALCIIDLDDFKVLNDINGFSFGDTVLKKVVEAIRKQIRDVDILIRYGGDEFVLAFDKIPREVFLTKMERIREEIFALEFEEAPGWKVSISMGCVYNDKDTIETEDVLRQLSLAKTSKNAVAIDNLIASFQKPEVSAQRPPILPERPPQIFSESMISSMIQAFATDFNMILWIDPDSGRQKVIQSRGVDEIWRHYAESMDARTYQNFFAETLIHPLDRQRFLEEMAQEKIVERFNEEDSFFIDHRVIENGVLIYYQTKFVKMPTVGAPNAYLTGGHSIDTEERIKVRQNEEYQQAVRRKNEQLSVISALAEDFDIVAYVDINSNFIRSYRINEIFRDFETEHNEIYAYDERLRLFAERYVSDSERAGFIEMSERKRLVESFKRSRTHFFETMLLVENREVPYQVKFVRNTENEVVFGLRCIEEEKIFEKNQEARFAQLLKERTAELMEKNKLLRHLNEEIVDSVGNIVEARDADSGEHVKRVKGFTKILAGYVMEHYPEYGLTEADVHTITNASALHDVGKIMIPDAILLKPDRLTDEEYEVIKTHSQKGCDVLSKMTLGWSEEYKRVATDICLNHHEKWDGSGYPNGLSGDEIPISAQIVSVADCFDALTSKRVYKEAISFDAAYDMILFGKCGAFSDKMKESFLACKDKLVHQALHCDQEPVSARAISSLQDIQILLVEDSDINREITKELLEGEGAIVRTATNGKEALDMFAGGRYHFDAILMDVQMPVMNGYEATRAIRQLGTKEAENVMIIALSAAYSADAVNECLLAGMDSHIRKPMSLNLVKQILFEDRNDRIVS